jgi:hypothetical protein
MKRLFFLLLLCTGIIMANNYNKGVDAYKNGDFTTALHYWEPYAKEGDVKAQYNIANLYYKGKGVEQNYKKALYWYHKASQQEHAKSLLKIGLMHCKGEGVLRSFKKAVPYVRSAYENGCVKAPEAWNKYELWKYE